MDEAPAETAADALKTETARQAVVLIFGVASLAIYVWAQRWASDPDQFRTWRMRAAKASERGWARIAGAAWRRAERARVAYERESA